MTAFDWITGIAAIAAVASVFLQPLISSWLDDQKKTTNKDTVGVLKALASQAVKSAWIPSILLLSAVCNVVVDYRSKAAVTPRFVLGTALDCCEVTLGFSLLLVVLLRRMLELQREMIELHWNSIRTMAEELDRRASLGRDHFEITKRFVDLVEEIDRPGKRLRGKRSR